MEQLTVRGKDLQKELQELRTLLDENDVEVAGKVDVR